MNAVQDLTPSIEDLIKGILEDKGKIRLRSKYPKFYIWNDEQLFLVGNITLTNIGAGNSRIKEINKEVSKILDILCIKHKMQNISIR